MEIVLESNSGIAQAELLAGRLEEAFQKSIPIIIDGSAITRVDTSVLQLLYSFCASMKETGVSVTWKEPSDELCQAAGNLGVKQLLGL
jgi:anti-anti-sigma regulatory factor